ncbi:MAG: hypothetical protein HY550_02620 [Elusimicrobia bacterium]|nr:hypothetical protein [Elusimicrobiota bacterium]
MKSLFLLSFLILAAGPSGAAGDGSAVEWKDGSYAAEFSLIEEEGRYDAGSWAALSAGARKHELDNAGAGDRAAARREEVRAYYAEMTKRWTLEEVSEKHALLDAGGIRAVGIWLGRDHAAYLERKRSALAPLRDPASVPITEESLKAAAQYLDPGAVSQLKAARLGGPVPPQLAEKEKKRQEELSGKVNGVKAAYGKAIGSGGGGEKFFDGTGQYSGEPQDPSPGLPRGAGGEAVKVSGNYRQSYAATVAGGAVPGIAAGTVQAAKKQPGFAPEDLKRIDSVVADMKQKRQAAGSENGWLGNFRQSVGLSKADSGCSSWSEATISAIKNDPVLGEKYEVGYVRGLRNPIGAVTKWPPSVPLPLPHFVAVVWPKGTDPNDTAIYVDSWAKDTKRGPIKDYTYEYSFDPKDLTPTVYYDRQVKKEIKLPGGRTQVVTENVETPIPLVKANPWIFVK